MPAVELDGRLTHVGFDFASHSEVSSKLSQWIRSESEFHHSLSRIRKHHADFLHHLRKSDVALAIGGDNYSLDYDLPVRHIDLDLLAKSYEIPCVLWAASIGPFSSRPDFEAFMRRHLEIFDLILCREDLSIQYLADLGVSPTKLHRVSDPAFIMPCQPPSPIHGDLNGHDFSTAIGLNLAGIIGRYWYAGNYDRWRRLCVQLLDHLCEKFGRPLMLIPHVMHATPWNDDHAFMAGMLSEVKNRGAITLINPHFSASELKYFISQLSCFVGSRLHSTIAGLSSCVPTLGISYSMKSIGIFKDMYGHDEFCITPRQSSVGLISEKVEHVLQHRAAIVDVLEKKMEATADQAYRSGEILQNFL